MKKKIILFLLLLIILTVAIILIVSSKFKSQPEENQIQNRFAISKIHYYSNVGSIKNGTTYQDPKWDLNIYQYTDIAIYLERLEEYSKENYINKIYLDNINISNVNIGEPKLFYLNPLDFGNDDITDYDEAVTDKIEYKILNDENEEDDFKYSIPLFFEDCSNPITLRYINYDIVKNYIIDSNEKVNLFSGGLLKRAEIDLVDIKSKITLDLNIELENGEKNKINVELEIPLRDGENEIYDSSIEVVKENK